jgi:hypothetical protein
MLSRGDFGAIMHIDIHPPLYVTSNTKLFVIVCHCVIDIHPPLYVTSNTVIFSVIFYVTSNTVIFSRRLRCYHAY